MGRGRSPLGRVGGRVSDKRINSMTDSDLSLLARKYLDASKNAKDPAESQRLHDEAVRLHDIYKARRDIPAAIRGVPVNTKKVVAKGDTDLSAQLHKNGLARMTGEDRRPYRSSTSSDRLVDLQGSDGKIYTGTWNKYFNGDVEVINIMESSKKSGSRRRQ